MKAARSAFHVHLLLLDIPLQVLQGLQALEVLELPPNVDVAVLPP